MPLLVDFFKSRRTDKRERHRAKPNRNFALVAFWIDDLEQLRSRHARRYPFDIQQYLPCLVDRYRHFKTVLNVHFSTLQFNYATERSAGDFNCCRFPLDILWAIRITKPS